MNSFTNMPASHFIFDLIGEPQQTAHQLANDIKRLSDFFINNPLGKTPWNEAYCQNAYRYYYLPLNVIRNYEVLTRAQQVGFFAMLKQNQITTTVDWGSGPATASLALSQHLENQIKQQILIDHSTQVLKHFQDLHSHLVHPQALTEFDLKKLNVNKNKSLLVFSYSLTEMTQLPEGYQDFHSILILEPSTQQDGRKLLEMREKLIKQNYFIWAPCTHQNPCPLLNESKHDWCHDRFHVHAPDWFKKVEQLLPFKNNTITTSYLLLSREKPPANLITKVRLVGDSLAEKGKTRQLICRDQNGQSQREFLTWMHKTLEPETLSRGELIELPQEYEIKSNEVRLKSKITDS